MSLAQLARGTIFANDFRIVEPLAEGGMGAVYVVEQISTSKRRALKLMHAQLVANPELRKRFEQEARIGARIESEHVVEVQTAGVDAQTGMPYLVMELLQGQDLATLVKQRGRLSPQEVGAIFSELCHAVGAAHAAGIVHRDLKPENIFLMHAKRAGVAYMVKVLDFGIAKLLAEGGTRHTEAIGSPIWLAPEQTERAEVTPATDVWALGLIAFHLLTGKYYWKSVTDDATVAHLLREILFEPLLPASVRAQQQGAWLPPAFDAWFARCVVRQPAARFPDARAAQHALAAVLAQPAALPAYAPPPYAPPVYAPPRPAPPRLAATPAAVSRTTPAAGSGVGQVLLWVLGILLAVGLVIGSAVTIAMRPPSYSGPALSYDDANSRFAKSMTPAPSIEPAAIVEKLKQDTTLDGCVSGPGKDVTWVSIKMVLVGGRVAGVTAETTPPNPTMATCVQNAVADVGWKTDDVARYEVWLTKRDGAILWPGY